MLGEGDLRISKRPLGLHPRKEAWNCTDLGKPIEPPGLGLGMQCAPSFRTSLCRPPPPPRASPRPEEPLPPSASSESGACTPDWLSLSLEPTPSCQGGWEISIGHFQLFHWELSSRQTYKGSSEARLPRESQMSLTQILVPLADIGGPL